MGMSNDFSNIQTVINLKKLNSSCDFDFVSKNVFILLYRHLGKNAITPNTALLRISVVSRYYQAPVKRMQQRCAFHTRSV